MAGLPTAQQLSRVAVIGALVAGTALLMTAVHRWLAHALSDSTIAAVLVTVLVLMVTSIIRPKVGD
jgi:hypothetical protein